MGARMSEVALPSSEPDSRTTTLDNGTRVTVIDRAPTAGERGWWIDGDLPLSMALTVVAQDSLQYGDYGWPVERGTEPLQWWANDRCITVVVERPDPVRE